MKPKIQIKCLNRGVWNVSFSIGVQTFTLAYTGNKEEVKWMAKMLKKAFNKLNI